MMLDYWRSGAIPDDAQVISSITRMTTAKVKNTAVQCCLVACLKFPKVSGLALILMACVMQLPRIKRKSPSVLLRLPKHGG